MKKPKAFFVVSQWNNDISWVETYTDRYVIYDKSDTLDATDKVIKIKNVGHNIFDICHYIVNNYEDLPKSIAFLEGNPFDHCQKVKFDKIIYNTKFTPIESSELDFVKNDICKLDNSFGFMELNNNWYVNIIKQQSLSENPERTVFHLSSYNDLLKKLFKNPTYPDWIRFAPGGQYIVDKSNILYYSRDFWKYLMSLVCDYRINPEAHIIERALYTIFSNEYQELGIYDNI